MVLSKKQLGCALLCATLVLSGCATVSNDDAALAAPGIISIDSHNAQLSTVHAEVVDAEHLAVSGVLRKRFHARGRIPGHLLITALGADGSVLEERTAAYHRRSSNSGKAYFRQTLRVPVATVRHVRVEHVGLGGRSE